MIERRLFCDFAGLRRPLGAWFMPCFAGRPHRPSPPSLFSRLLEWPLQGQAKRLLF
jgi:hypothetical protein